MNKKGVILVSVYLLIAVLMIFGGAFVSRSISEHNIARQEKEVIKAFYISEAGLAIAYQGLELNWTGYTTGLPRSNVFTQSVGEGSFSVDLEAGPVVDTVKVISRGTAGSIVKSLEEVIRGTVGEGMPGFDFAALAGGNLFLDGNGSIENQDVYVNGNLQIQSTDAITGGNIYAKGNTTLSNGGTITGNVNSNGNITVEVGSVITGDATSAKTVNNNGTITGLATSGASPDPVDEVDLQAKVDSYRLSDQDWTDYETQAVSEGNYHAGNFSPSGSYTGTHYVEGTLNISADVSGAAVFVVDGSVNFNGGDVGLSPPAGNDYSFIVKQNITSSVGATGTLSGAIYAEGNFNIDSAITFEGAVICFGNLYGSGDFSISFPVAGTALEVLSWREL